MKTDRLDAYLESNELEAVWLAGPDAVKWFCGGDVVVARGASVGVGAIGYTGSETILVTNNIEAPRLEAEEVPADVRVEFFNWYENSLAGAVAEETPYPAAADFDVPGTDPVDLTNLRQPLTGEEIDRYRELAATVATAVESTARAATPEKTERTVANELRAALVSEDFDVPVALVGGEARAPKYRHFTPKDVTLDGYAILSVTASKDGLYTSCTRTVTFDPPSWLRNRTRVAMGVEVAALEATQTVETAGEAFGAIQEAYEALDWAGEWQHHHQGGASGYAGREWKATPDGEETVYRPMAYAWNPTVKGAKSEDTHLVTDETVEILSSTGDWPTTSVQSPNGALTLERHLPLSL